MESYDHRKIEKKWGKYWQSKKIYKTQDKIKDKSNFYALVEFPYPSGNLHVGHWYAYIGPDIYARFLRLNGKNVLFPIGFDAFGLPAENAALKHGLNPKKWTYGNIAYMRRQLQMTGGSFDWSREIITCDPGYYKWTQWLFLKLFEKGLVYRKETPSNWCPSCKTVLANEQVVNGLCERCDTSVEKKNLPQWNIKISDYAERLLADLEKLDWPEPIKESQRNWIGKSEGAEISFQLLAVSFQENSKLKAKSQKLEAIQVFTTRSETIFGASYLVLAPEHPWLEQEIRNPKSEIRNKSEIQNYINKTKQRTEIERTAEGKEKSGIELKGIKAINPANGEEIPVWIADYVLPQYGTGAIMAVPAHDQRDFEFAKKYNLPTRKVIEPSLVQTTGSSTFRPDEPFVEGESIIALIKHWKEEKYLGLRWSKAPDWGTLLTGGIEEGMTAEETLKKEILEEIGYKNLKKISPSGKIHVKFYHVPKKTNKFVHANVFYVELANGEQMQISEDERKKHEIIWLTPEELENFLTAIAHQQAFKNFKEKAYTGTGFLQNSEQFNNFDSAEAKDQIIKFVGGRKKTVYKLRDWIVSRQRYWGTPIPLIHCKSCGAAPVPEKDLPVKLPEIKDYLPRDDGKSPLAKAEKWLKVKCPRCQGPAERETDTLDTFVDSSWYFLRYTDPKNGKKFADAKKMANWLPVDFYSGGAEHTTMHLLYSRFWQKVLYDLKLVKDKEPYKKRMNRGLILGPDGNKMSKSKGNVIDPDEIVKKIGADAVRTYLAFIGPFNEGGSYPWSAEGIIGVRRFLEKVWKLKDKIGNSKFKIQDSELKNLINQTIKKVTAEIESLKLNTAVSQLMILTNRLSRQERVRMEDYRTLLVLLAPFAPYLTEELWRRLGQRQSIHLTTWPKSKKTRPADNHRVLPVQINGRVRGRLTAGPDENQEDLKKRALSRPELQKWLAGKQIKKVFYVKNKILNLLVD